MSPPSDKHRRILCMAGEQGRSHYSPKEHVAHQKLERTKSVWRRFFLFLVDRWDFGDFWQVLCYAGIQTMHSSIRTSPPAVKLVGGSIKVRDCSAVSWPVRLAILDCTSKFYMTMSGFPYVNWSLKKDRSCSKTMGPNTEANRQKTIGMLQENLIRICPCKEFQQFEL